MKVTVKQKKIVVEPPPKSYELHLTELSDREAQILFALFGGITGSGTTRKFTDKIWNELKSAGIENSYGSVLRGTMQVADEYIYSSASCR